MMNAFRSSYVEQHGGRGDPAPGWTGVWGEGEGGVGAKKDPKVEERAGVPPERA